MAILQKGQIVRQGSPLGLVSELTSQVWAKQIDRKAEINPNWTVISARMLKGKRSVRVWSETCPAKGFEQVEPDLNDVYFTALLNQESEQSTMAVPISTVA
mgnify:CR=1 FL=1